MTPNRAATIFRELLQTPDAELGQLARRAGLRGPLDPQDLSRARELLEAVAQALESNRRADWDRLRDGWTAMRSKRSSAATSAAAEVAGAYTAEPSRPGWVRSESVAKPSLGAAAPGLDPSGQPARGQLIPAACPAEPPTPSQPDPSRPPLPDVPAMLAPVGAGSAQPIVPQTPAGFTVTGQPVPPAGIGPPPVPVARASPSIPSTAPQGAGPTGLTPAPAPPHHAPAGAAEGQSAAAPAQQAFAAAPEGAPPPASSRAAPAVDDGGSIYQSVAKYAAFCAACAQSPDRLADTLAGYGVRDGAERAAINQHWQDRFDDEPEVLTKWEELFAHFRRTLGQSP